MRSLGISRLFDLVEVSLGETNGEETENVTVGGSDVDVSLDQGLPFLDDRTEFVGGEVHAVEGGETALAL